MAAIGAVDTALWDIKAKAADMPLYELLGGASREAVLVYAHANGKDTEAALRDVAAHLDLGYKAIRVQSGVPGPGLALTACPRAACPTSRPRRALPVRARVEHRGLRRLHPAAVRARARRVRPRAAPAARRPSPADADRGGSRRQEPRAVSPVVDGGSGAGGAAGRLPRDPAAHHHADRRRRGLQLDLRLPAADHRAADRLHPDHRGARRRDQRSCGRSPRWPSSTTFAPAAMAPPT